MQVSKNKNGTYDLKGVTFGKLLAIVSAINKTGVTTAVQSDVRAIIENNPDYRAELNEFVDKK